MKKKLYILSIVLFSTLAFTGCEEEVIMPENDTTGTNDGSEGVEKEDEGQFD